MTQRMKPEDMNSFFAGGVRPFGGNADNHQMLSTILPSPAAMTASSGMTKTGMNVGAGPTAF